MHENIKHVIRGRSEQVKPLALEIELRISGNFQMLVELSGHLSSLDAWFCKSVIWDQEIILIVYYVCKYKLLWSKIRNFHMGFIFAEHCSFKKDKNPQETVIKSSRTCPIYVK